MCCVNIGVYVLLCKRVVKGGGGMREGIYRREVWTVALHGKG